MQRSWYHQSELYHTGLGDNKKEQGEQAFSERVRRISNKSGDEVREEILKMYPDVFSSLGRLEPAYHMELDPKARPAIHPTRKIPASLRENSRKNSMRCRRMA